MLDHRLLSIRQNPTIDPVTGSTAVGCFAGLRLFAADNRAGRSHHYWHSGGSRVCHLPGRGKPDSKGAGYRARRTPGLSGIFREPIARGGGQRTRCSECEIHSGKRAASGGVSHLWPRSFDCDARSSSAVSRTDHPLQRSFDLGCAAKCAFSFPWGQVHGEDVRTSGRPSSSADPTAPEMLSYLLSLLFSIWTGTGVAWRRPSELANGTLPKRIETAIRTLSRSQVGNIWHQKCSSGPYSKQPRDYD